MKLPAVPQLYAGQGIQAKANKKRVQQLCYCRTP